MIDKAVFIEPTTDHFANDQLFNVENTFLNRDGTLLPFARLKQMLNAEGIPVHTADLLHTGKVVAKKNYYYSIGLLSGYKKLLNRSDVQLSGFFLLEPPLVVPYMYKALPELSRHFRKVYVHNEAGHQYLMKGVDSSRLEKLYWPQPYAVEQEPYWSRLERSDKLVIIAGNHRPRRGFTEYYSRRIHAVAELSSLNAVDLYGRGWGTWWSRHSMWFPYWQHRSALLGAYRGACSSKLEVLSQYQYSLCFENMPMNGYITEKIFDCLYAGTVPIYLGAPDIEHYIPPACFVDMRKFASYKEAYTFVKHLPRDEWIKMRLAGQAFLREEQGQRYYNGFIDTIVRDVRGV